MKAMGGVAIFCRRVQEHGEDAIDIVALGRSKARDKAAESGFEGGFRVGAASHCKGKAGALMYHCRFDPMIDDVASTLVNRFAVVSR